VFYRGGVIIARRNATIKERISRTSLIVYVVLLILSGFLPSVAGSLVGWFCIIGIFAIPPIIVGSKRYQVLGIIALLLAIAAAVTDYHAGKITQNRFDEIRKKHEEKVSTPHTSGVDSAEDG